MITCPKCHSEDDYHLEHAAQWDKIVCNECNYYIGYIEKVSNSTPADSGAINKTTNMSQGQGFYGSFCLEDLFGTRIGKASNGKQYVCIDDLATSPFQVGKNGKHYVNIGVWINEDIDQYGNIAGISLSQSMPEREQGAKKVYIGNLRRSGPAAAPAQQPQQGYQQPQQGYQQPAQGGYQQPQQGFAQPQQGGYAPQPALANDLPF